MYFELKQTRKIKIEMEMKSKRNNLPQTEVCVRVIQALTGVALSHI